jgi:Pyruvate phosphate dikinase, AMP/ATP-binding domain
MDATTATRWIYDFAEGSRDMRTLLGGKGAGIAEMTRVLGPDLVPAGFTITTEACVEYMRAGRAEPDGLAAAVGEALERLEARAGKQLGDPEDPLLVSVRSGARDSMPGMMDTVLNLGLNDASVEGLAAGTGNTRFAWDSYRRLVQMFGDVVCGVPGARFEDEIARIKRERGVTLDTELDADALRDLTARFRGLYDFSQDPRDQPPAVAADGRRRGDRLQPAGSGGSDQAAHRRAWRRRRDRGAWPADLRGRPGCNPSRWDRLVAGRLRRQARGAARVLRLRNRRQADPDHAVPGRQRADAQADGARAPRTARPAPLLTHRFALDDIEGAYELFGNQREGVVKVVLTP